jgi:histidine triad (HIT) family protein
MNDSVFTKIIKGEIPAYRIYEDDKTLAFLDIHPENLGHTLVVPKVQVDKIYDLSDDYYQAMWQTAKKLAQNMEKVLGKRIIFKVIGVDVPHAHIHLIPIKDAPQSPAPAEAKPADLAEIQVKLAIK